MIRLLSSDDPAAAMRYAEDHELACDVWREEQWDATLGDDYGPLKDADPEDP